jgi:hypothetical protein
LNEAFACEYAAAYKFELSPTPARLSRLSPKKAPGNARGFVGRNREAPLFFPLPDLVDGEQVAQATLDGVDRLRSIEGGDPPAVVGERERIGRELVVKILDAQNQA